MQLSASTNPSILADHFIRLFTDLPPAVMVIATATSSSDLHPSLQAKHVFGETLKLAMPTKEVRAEVRPSKRHAHNVAHRRDRFYNIWLSSNPAEWGKRVRNRMAAPKGLNLSTSSRLQAQPRATRQRT